MIQLESIKILLLSRDWISRVKYILKCIVYHVLCCALCILCLKYVTMHQ